MTSSIPLYFTETLDKERLDILPTLSHFTQRWFYLAGGTALAIIFGHRESIDFDFFCKNDFDTRTLFAFCQEIFEWKHIEKIMESKNTLWITIDAIKISFFTLKNELLEPLIHTEYIDIASVPDIAAMKLWAIQNRATNKDYIDLACIIDHIGLRNTLQSFSQKHGDIVSDSQLLKSLLYFEDIENEPLKLKKHQKNWEETKLYLQKIIKADFS